MPYKCVVPNFSDVVERAGRFFAMAYGEFGMIDENGMKISAKYLLESRYKIRSVTPAGVKYIDGIKFSRFRLSLCKLTNDKQRS
ncbi:MAG TPA: hypothetical protein PLZ05_00990 [Alphaproteobacteria bacterium]|nr:hypothetical protein [Alphaproteobacteria bacterium]